jgi:hypothetical protein
MAGMVISAATEKIPGHLPTLVHVAADLPRNASIWLVPDRRVERALINGGPSSGPATKWSGCDAAAAHL